MTHILINGKMEKLYCVHGKYRRFFCNNRQNCQMIPCRRESLHEYVNCGRKDAVLSVCLNHIPNCDISDKPGTSKCLYCQSYLCDKYTPGFYCEKCHDIGERKSISDAIAMTIDSPMDVILIITEYTVEVVAKCSYCTSMQPILHH